MNTGAILKEVQKKYLRADLPEFEVGDVIKMRIKTQEADKVRLHPFDGTVIRKSEGKGMHASFTVRKVTFGEGIEKTFPSHSPIIDSIEIVSKGKVNRAKLYYLRNRFGKQAKIKKRTEASVAAPAASAS
ncbi:MAG: 50S ribosomal protein L19 [Candidatus Omnitrophica bacterium]|nr:50S ribosomal protein L19 [Candidatus Omnitrophota bacterium]